MINDMSRSFFHAPAKRRVYVQRPSEDKEGGEEEMCGTVQLFDAWHARRSTTLVRRVFTTVEHHWVQTMFSVSMHIWPATGRHRDLCARRRLCEYRKLGQVEIISDAVRYQLPSKDAGIVSRYGPFVTSKDIEPSRDVGCQTGIRIRSRPAPRGNNQTTVGHGKSKRYQHLEQKKRAGQQHITRSN